MKKCFILFLLSLLFCACNYELDPYDLQPWKEQMSMYMGTSVYNPGDSISFLHNDDEQCQFAIISVYENLDREHDHSLFPSHKKQPIDCAFLNLQIGNFKLGMSSNAFYLEVFREKNELAGVRISLYGNDDCFRELDVMNDIDFSNDTLVLNSCQGNSVTLVRHIGITEIKSASGDIWELLENH